MTKANKKIKEVRVPYNFTPRTYQLPVFKSFEEGVKNIDLVAHRRSGKDKICFAILAREMCLNVGAYFYVFPEFNQGRKALWDNIDNDGFRTLEHIPKDLWSSKNDTQMKLTLRNGSYLQVVGSNDVDALMGVNVRGIVYSEYSLQNPLAYGYLSPIIKANNGFQIFNYTPRGYNHAKDLHDYAKANKEFASFTLTVDNTKLFSKEQLENIRQEYIQIYGNDALFLQEYYCSFEKPVLGSYYGHFIIQAENENRINDSVVYDNTKGVYVSWDLGVGDSTSMWFIQKNGNIYKAIDYYENFGVGLEHYVEVLRKKGYEYIRHYLPHDSAYRQQGRDERVLTRKDILQDLGVRNIVVAPKTGVNEGIEKVRQLLPSFYFNKTKCERGIQALKEYRQQYDEKLRMFSTHPVHDWTSHAADALRYFAVCNDFDNLNKSQVDMIQLKLKRMGYNADLWY